MDHETEGGVDGHAAMTPFIDSRTRGMLVFGGTMSVCAILVRFYSDKDVLKRQGIEQYSLVAVRRHADKV